jgi:L-methionine (R)-S-oxide reductase
MAVHAVPPTGPALVPDTGVGHFPATIPPMDRHHHIDLTKLEEHVRELVASEGTSREERVRAIASEIAAAGAYRWVGIYDVTPSLVRIVAFSGPGAPAFPEFLREQGLTGEALRSGHTIVADDVQNDPLYLTAFGTTRSEMIVPIRTSETIVGTIDVESERISAFGQNDRDAIEKVARAIAPLFS